MLLWKRWQSPPAGWCLGRWPSTGSPAELQEFLQHPPEPGRPHLQGYWTQKLQLSWQAKPCQGANGRSNVPVVGAAPEVSAAPGKLWPALASGHSRADSTPGTNAPTSYKEGCLSFASLHSIHLPAHILSRENPALMGSVQPLCYRRYFELRENISRYMQATGGADFTASCVLSDVPWWHSSHPASSAWLSRRCEPLAGGDAILHSNVTATDAVGLGRLPTRCCAAARLRLVQLKEKKKKVKVVARPSPALPVKPSGFPSAQGEGGDSMGWQSAGNPAPGSPAVVQQMWWHGWDCPALPAERAIGAAVLHTTIFSSLALASLPPPLPPPRQPCSAAPHLLLVSESGAAVQPFYWGRINSL